MVQDFSVLGPDNARIESKPNSRFLKHVSNLKIFSLRIRLFSNVNIECPRMANPRLICWQEKSDSRRYFSRSLEEMELPM